MNILQILPSLNTGGVERGTVELTEYLVSQGHKAVVVSAGGRWMERINRAGGIHYKLSVGQKNIFTMFFSVFKLANIIEQEQIDIVHARSRVPAWIAYRAVRIVNKKRFRNMRYPKIVNFVTTAHGLYRPGYFSQLMGRGKRVIAPSSFIKSHLVNKLKVDENKIVVIPRSVDLSVFSYKPFIRDNKYVFAVIGRISRNKGHLIAIRAFAKVLRLGYDAQLWIIGEPNKAAKKNRYLDQLKTEVVKLGIADRVRFLGAKRDVNLWLEKVFAVLVPSIYPESFGRVVIEAQAVGRAVIVSDLPALNELVIDGKTGLIAKPSDVNDWAEKMRMLIENSVLYEKIVQQAYKTVGKFSLETTCEKILDVYKELLDSYRIGVVKVSALGDIVLSGYALKSIKKNFPGSEVVVIGSELTKNLWTNEKVFCLTDRNNWFGFARGLRAYGIDIVYDLQNSTYTQLISWVTGAYRRFGFNRKLGWLLLTDPIVYKRDYPIKEQKWFLEHCGLRGNYSFDTLIDVREQEKENLYLRLQANSDISLQGYPMVMVVISASWPSKNFSYNQLLYLISQIISRGMVVVLSGVKSDEDLAKRLVEGLSADEKNFVINFVGQSSVGDFIALIDMVDLVITPDSSAMHIAYALRKHCVVYFGPTGFRRHLPEGSCEFIDFVYNQGQCNPCYKKRCLRQDKVCLKNLEKQVIAILDQLKEKLNYNYR